MIYCAPYIPFAFSSTLLLVSRRPGRMNYVASDSDTRTFALLRLSFSLLWIATVLNFFSIKVFCFPAEEPSVDEAHLDRLSNDYKLIRHCFVFGLLNFSSAVQFFQLGSLIKLKPTDVGLISGSSFGSWLKFLKTEAKIISAVLFSLESDRGCKSRGLIYVLFALLKRPARAFLPFVSALRHKIQFPCGWICV